jgi:hypothetical protein
MADVRAAHRTATLIMYAVMAILVVYTIAVEAISRTSSSPDPAPEPGAIRYIFYAVAVAMIFLSQVVKATMLRDPSRFSLEEVVKKLTQANIAVAALVEVPVLLGLVSFFMWRETTDYYVLAFVSLYVALRHFPRYGSWERVAQAAARRESQ